MLGPGYHSECRCLKDLSGDLAPYYSSTSAEFVNVREILSLCTAEVCAEIVEAIF